MFQKNLVTELQHVPDKHRLRSKLQELYEETRAIYVCKNFGEFTDDRYPNGCLKPDGSKEAQNRNKFVEDFDGVFCGLHKKVGVDPESIEVIEKKVDEKLAALGRYRKVGGYMCDNGIFQPPFNALLGKEAKDLLLFICTPVHLYGPDPCAECGNSNIPEEVDSSSEVSKEDSNENDSLSCDLSSSDETQSLKIAKVKPDTLSVLDEARGEHDSKEEKEKTFSEGKRVLETSALSKMKKKRLTKAVVAVLLKEAS
jgi:hypothetical protein